MLIAFTVFAIWASMQAAQVDRLRLVREALRVSDISPEKLRYWWSDIKTGKPMDKALVHRKLHGEAKLTWDDLCRLPVKFWQNLGFLTLQEVGMSREMRKAFVFAVALYGQRQMARMEMAQRKKVSA